MSDVSMRFVILKHSMPEHASKATHLDLMLEVGESLRTWSIATWPQPGESVAATELANHRLEYLEYEGPVSDDRGSVQRLDQGTYEIQNQSPDELRITIAGATNKCELSLHRQSPNAWTLKCTK